MVLVLLGSFPDPSLRQRPDGKSLEVVLFRFLFETVNQIYGTVPECADCGVFLLALQGTTHEEDGGPKPILRL